jgi:hypothetical protein
MRSRKNILRIPNRHLEVGRADRRNPSHLAILDKSQVIEAGLIRRNFAKNPLRSIRCKFSIDGAEWNNRLCPPIRNHNNVPAETCDSPFARANARNSPQGYGVLPRSVSP